MSLNREVTKEGCDFLFAHLGWVAFFVEEDEAANPIEARFLGANAVTLDAQMPTNVVE